MYEGIKVYVNKRANTKIARPFKNTACFFRKKALIAEIKPISVTKGKIGHQLPIFISWPVFTSGKYPIKRDCQIDKGKSWFPPDA